MGAVERWIHAAAGLVLIGAHMVAGPTPGHAVQVPDADRLIADLSSADATTRAMAACYLGRMTASDVRPARDTLLALLADDTEVEPALCRDWRGGRGQFGDETSSPGREAAIALEELGEEVVDPLVGLLADGAAAVRENAAFALGLVESTRATRPLASALADDSVGRVRARAAWALGMIESSAGVDPLVSALSDADAEVREQAAWGLGMIESSAAVSGLARAIEDENSRVREEAAWALGMIESSSGVEPLLVALSDVDAEVREQAAWGLGMIQDPAATDGLVQALEDPDGRVREQAMWALGMVLQSGGFGQVDRQELSAALRTAIEQTR